MGADRKSTDEVAEWLRRWTANPLGSPRVGSNPILVVNFIMMTSNLYCNAWLNVDLKRNGNNRIITFLGMSSKYNERK